MSWCDDNDYKGIKTDHDKMVSMTDNRDSHSNENNYAHNYSSKMSMLAFIEMIAVTVMDCETQRNVSSFLVRSETHGGEIQSYNNLN